MTFRLAVGALALVAACAGAAPRETRLVASRTDAVSTSDAIGPIRAVVATDEALFVFGERGLSTIEHGVATGVEPLGSPWTAASRIPAADGRGEWVVGVDASGALFRARAPAGVERVSARFGLDGVRVRDVSAAGSRGAAFLLDDGVVIADGTDVRRYSLNDTITIAGSADRVAVSLREAIVSFDPARRQWTRLPLAGVVRMSFTPAGQLVAATSHAIYAEDAHGNLQRLITGESVGAIAVARDLWSIVDGHLVRRTLSGAPEIARTAESSWRGSTRLVAATSGTIWAVDSHAIAPVDIGAVGDTGADAWTRTVRPLFARNCAGCHLPGGSADVDLSTYAAWEHAREEIRRRVVVERTMPPRGHTLSAGDLQAIAAWLSAQHG